jgi:hypothetical protein
MYTSDVPGPGQYIERTLTDDISKKPWGKKGVFGSTAGRFQSMKTIQLNDAQPGPGTYKPEASIAMLDNKKNSSIKRSSSVFLSTTVRAPNSVRKFKDTSPSGGSYDIEQYSLASGVKKKIESGLGNPLLASLKSKMKLVAPFNSCSERFKARTIKDHEKFLGPGYYEFKNFAEEQLPQVKFSAPTYNSKCKVYIPPSVYSLLICTYNRFSY